MRTTLIAILTALLSIAAAVAALTPGWFYLWPWLTGCALIAMVATLLSTMPWASLFKSATPAPAVAVSDGMPALHEIEASIRRLRRILASNGDLVVPDPPNGVDVACEQCEVVEHYVYSSNAAESTHLLDHPERCRVTESGNGAPWLLKSFEVPQHEETTTVAHA